MHRNNFIKSPLSLRKKAILTVSGIFLSLALLELGLRLAGFVFLSLQEYRNRAAIYKKDTYRIMCLGESTTAVGGKDSYPSQLEEVLNQRHTGIKFSVINKGAPNINTSYILAHLEENLNQYQPDMVTAMMSTNDKLIKYYEGIPEANTFLFKKFKAYRFLRLLWMNMAKKIRKIGIYKPEEKAKATTLRSNLSAVALKKSEGELKKDIELNPRNDMAYVELGRFYRNQGKFIQAEEAFKKALELNPKNNNACLGLGHTYERQGKFSQAEEVFKKALELNPENDSVYFDYLGLGHTYEIQNKFSQAEELFKKAIELNPKNDNAYLGLGHTYERQGKFSQAEEVFKKAIELNSKNERMYGALSLLYKEMGNAELEEKYDKKANELRSTYYNLTTINNYRKLKEILDTRGIKLVCIQYPMHSIEPLKKMFEGQDGVLFIDNEKLFKDAVKKEGFKKYFSDMFAGDFGHCTREGSRLIAQNLANVILKECFNQ